MIGYKKNNPKGSELKMNGVSHSKNEIAWKRIVIKSHKHLQT